MIEILLVFLLVFGYFFLASDQVTWRRLLLYFVLLICAAGLINYSISRPEPYWMLFKPVKGMVLNAVSDEQEHIYIWLMLPGQSEPRAFSIPYSNQRMSKIQQGMAEAKRAGRPLEATIKRGELSVDKILGHSGEGHGLGNANGVNLSSKLQGQGDSLGAGRDPFINIQLAPIPPFIPKSDPQHPVDHE